jgi:uncharacterized membrane protein
VSVTTREDVPVLGEFEPLEAPRGMEAVRKIGIPVAGVLVGLLAILVFLEPGLRQDTLTFIGIYLVPGGIDAAPPFAVGVLGLSPWWTVGVVFYFDLFLTLFWVWNLDHLARFEFVDRRIEKSRQRAHSLWQRFPWLQVASGPGLALFIMLPIPTTGSFTGITVGKLIELPDPVTYLASVGATSVRVAALAFGTGGILSFL